MTSIMHPALAASRLADQAISSLSVGNDVLLGRDIRPMYEPFPGTTPTSRFERAAQHGDNALGHIDHALSFGASGMLSRGVLSAFTNARTEASAGVTLLRAKTMMPLNPNTVVLKFDGAKLWLDMAKSLIQLDLGGNRPTEPVVVRPPVTILPVPRPEVEAPEAMTH
ncbi:MAG: hypothetical protein JWL76_2043 [Thermoleophilia bacterium]|nr:hypothetical protein [Thermoleophilia bacterium]